ncbi:MAG TPA: formimidoylglutamase [Edaphocola sp.]|nr:formimidoylglutamase [Edaphocola sp.]
MNIFSSFLNTDIDRFLNFRIGEQKLGNTVLCPNTENWEAWLQQTTARFIILGIPEDIGVRANGGIGGTFTAWESFLKAFINIQDNAFFSGSNIGILGNVFVQDLMEQNTLDAPIEHLKSSVENIDERVFPVIEKIIINGKIPIVIGGGHNNAFPILKGLSLAKDKAVNVINMDAHADFRALEGRHSGNGFSYAYHQHFLKKYAAFGLHEAYNNAEMVERFNQNNDLFALWMEDIYLRNKVDFEKGLADSLAFVAENDFGVELDIDSIQDTLSSAQSPLGFSRIEACKYLNQCGKQKNSAYLHLPEAISIRNDGLKYPFIGKLLSYLVQAFIKGKIESQI